MERPEGATFEFKTLDDDFIFAKDSFWMTLDTISREKDWDFLEYGQFVPIAEDFEWDFLVDIYWKFGAKRK